LNQAGVRVGRADELGNLEFKFECNRSYGYEHRISRITLNIHIKAGVKTERFETYRVKLEQIMSEFYKPPVIYAIAMYMCIDTRNYLDYGFKICTPSTDVFSMVLAEQAVFWSTKSRHIIQEKLFFKLHRGHVTQGRMQSFTVIKHFYVMNDIGFSLLPC